MRKMLKAGCSLLMIATIMVAISACASDKGSSNANLQSTASSGPVSEVSQPQSSDPESAAKQISAEEIANQLKTAGLPIDNIIVYTEDNDPNKLLGRPNEYISKVNFADTSVEQGDDKSNPVGGSIETFNNADDLKTRKDYCESISKASPLFAQYYYVNGNYLLRIDNDVTPSNAKKYEVAFEKIGE